jgi:Leucine-rich repeat (LRR) protein
MYFVNKPTLTLLLTLFLIVFFTPSFAQSGNYKNIKQAVKNADTAIRLDLTDEFIHDDLHRLGKLTRLRELILANNDLEELPVQVCELKFLAVLSSKKNKLNSLPDCFSNLENLQELELYDASIKDLSPLKGLFNLKKLTLFDNANSLTLGEEFETLGRLKYLNIINTSIDSISSSIVKLSELEGLNLYQCSLTEIPELSELKTLKILILDNNQLSGKIPESIYQLTSLVNLSLENNQLTEIDDSIGNLKNLRQINLKGNKLSDYQLDIIRVLLPQCEIVK